MAGRVGDAERLAREAYELGRRAQARDAETIYAAQMLILRRREDALPDYVVDDRELRQREPRARRLARDPADGAPAGRQHAGGRGRSSASWRRDEFAAIPRDMFWFTAIALLGETCALIGDTEQAPVLYRLLEPHRDKLVQVTQAASLGSTHRFLALLSAAKGDLDARRGALRARRWSATSTAACGRSSR